MERKLFKIVLLDAPAVRKVSIKAVIDILMYHGSAAFETDDNDDKRNVSDEDLFEEEDKDEEAQVLSSIRL